jgi:hypothetical protein
MQRSLAAALLLLGLFARAADARADDCDADDSREGCDEERPRRIRIAPVREEIRKPAAPAGLVAGLALAAAHEGSAAVVFRGCWLFPGCPSYSAWLWLPLIGPWIALGQNASRDPLYVPSDAVAVYVASGILQAVAFSSMIFAFVYAQKVPAPLRAALQGRW